ncbi:MAG: DUF922 domain-containing protein [Devosia sp.]
MRASRRPTVRLALLCATAAVVALTVPADGAVTSRTKYQSYKVGGTTEKGIVSYMRQHPYRGDSGHAYANITHYYSLKVDTEQDGKMCKVEDIDLAMSFVITLPVPARPSALTKSAKQSFKNFASFTRTHEETHRANFIACGKSFAAKAGTLTAGQCRALVTDVRNMLRQTERDCEARQASFDKQDAAKVNGLALFRKGWN